MSENLLSVELIIKGPIVGSTPEFNGASIGANEVVVSGRFTTSLKLVRSRASMRPPLFRISFTTDPLILKLCLCVGYLTGEICSGPRGFCSDNISCFDYESQHFDNRTKKRKKDKNSSRGNGKVRLTFINEILVRKRITFFKLH